MKGNLKSELPPSAEAIAQKADKGQDISSHFTNDGRMMPALGIPGSAPNEADTEMYEE